MAETNRDCWVGFDLGGTKMLSVVYDAAFKSLGRKRRKTKGHEGVKSGLDRMADTIEDAAEEAGIDADRMRGIGVGCPGPLDLSRGVILEAPNLGWKDAPVRDYLQDRFGCPVEILNDVDSGLYGEYRFGSAEGARCVVGIFPGTGVGGACVYEGRILRGKVSSCMEVGFMKIESEGIPAGLGPAGTLEGLASRLAISAEAAQAAYRGQAPNLRELAGTDLSQIRSGVLAEAIEKGDTIVADIIHRAAGHVGTAVGNLVNLLAPDVIVLGGGLVEAMPDLYLSAVRKSARLTALPSFEDSYKVKVARLGDDAAVMGAAAWIQEIISSDSSSRKSMQPG